EIAEQVARGLGLIAEDDGHVAGLLNHPDAVRVRRHSRDVHATATDMHEKEDKDIDEPASGPHLLREEVAGPECLGMSFDEVVPGSFAALRPRIESIFEQDVADGAARALADAELSQLTGDAQVAPAVLARQPQNQLPNLLRLPRSAGIGRLPFLAFAAQPAC